MLSAHYERVKKLHGMPRKARDIFWWPFTQHKLVQEGGITVIDSFGVHGENIHTLDEVADVDSLKDAAKRLATIIAYINE